MKTFSNPEQGKRYAQAVIRNGKIPSWNGQPQVIDFVKIIKLKRK
jgi:hypothetical protein